MKISAKKNSACCQCTAGVKVGEEIYWERGSSYVTHVACAVRLQDELDSSAARDEAKQAARDAALASGELIKVYVTRDEIQVSNAPDVAAAREAARERAASIGVVLLSIRRNGKVYSCRNVRSYYGGLSAHEGYAFPYRSV